MVIADIHVGVAAVDDAVAVGSAAAADVVVAAAVVVADSRGQAAVRVKAVHCSCLMLPIFVASEQQRLFPGIGRYSMIRQRRRQQRWQP